MLFFCDCPGLQEQFFTKTPFYKATSCFGHPSVECFRGLRMLLNKAGHNGGSIRSHIRRARIVAGLASVLGLTSFLISFVMTSLIFSETTIIWKELDKEMEEFEALSKKIWDDMIDLRPQQRQQRQADDHPDGGFGLGVDTPSGHGFQAVLRSRAFAPMFVGRNGPQTAFSLDDGKNYQDKCRCGPINQCPSGPPGPRGVPGEAGPDGIPGFDGKPGFDGISQPYFNGKCYVCPDGPQGPGGQPGLAGPQGMRGADGRPGMQGTDGQPGAPGPPGPPGSPGNPGKVGLKGPPGNPVHVARGLKGPRGIPGLIGPAGDKGLPGKEGVPGIAGDIGPPGSVGPVGLPGLIGEQGSPGIMGDHAPDGGYCPCPPRRFNVVSPAGSVPSSESKVIAIPAAGAAIAHWAVPQESNANLVASAQPPTLLSAISSGDSPFVATNFGPVGVQAPANVPVAAPASDIGASTVPPIVESSRPELNFWYRY